MTEVTDTPTASEAPVFQYRCVRDRNRKPLHYLFTPMNHAANNWSYTNLANTTQWGKSYIVNPERGAKLKSFMLYKCGFKLEQEPSRKPYCK